MLSTVLDLARAGLFALAHWCGGSAGAAIVVASVALRIVMLPVSVRATRRRLEREAKLRALGPEIAALRRRHASRPRELWAATRRLHEAHGLSGIDSGALAASLLQFPPAAALYSAIRSLPRGTAGLFWVRDLVSPDRALAAVAAVVTAAAAWGSAAGADGGRIAQIAPLVVSAVITFAILSHLSAGVALYSVTNSVIGAAEQAAVRRNLARSRR